MNEVRQAWTSLRSPSRASTLASGVANQSNGSSTTTWYDIPAPVIIHCRSFLEDEEAEKVAVMQSGSTPTSNGGPEVVGREKSNGTKIDERNKDTTEVEVVPYIVETDAREETEVLYQNNLEAALNSLSKVCAEKVTVEAEDGKDNSEDCSRKRLSSTLELTAKTSVKTDADGVPTISFSFLRTDEGIKDADERSGEEAEEHQLYDIPKSPSRLSVEAGSISKEDKDEDKEEDSGKNGGYKSDIESSMKVLDIQPLKKDRTKRSTRSLKSGRRSYGTENDSYDVGITSGSYSDPECQNDAFSNLRSGRRVKFRKHKIGKAWEKMRCWLREEKTKIGEVVNRHARLQAVGALSNDSQDEESASRISRNKSASYDLTKARARESGSITKVEEFGLSAVSEEASSDADRASRSPDSGKGDSRKTTEMIENNENPAESYELSDTYDTYDPTEPGENRQEAMNNSENSENVENVESVENPSVREAQRMLAQSYRTLSRGKSTDNILGSRTRGKLPPVSFSMDKLCSDPENEEVVNRCETETGPGRDGANGKGGLIKRRMLGSIRGLMASTHLLQAHESEEGGQSGFEDVRRYVKQGGDFCKELAAILHERAELEATYAKGLSKLSSKLTKACAKDQGGNSAGGVNEAWRCVGEEMEAAAEAHRVWGIALGEQLAKPLRVGVAEAQGRSRKSIENSVDKASKSLQEWRGVAAKSKKQSFACARENERLQDLARLQSISQSQQNNNKSSTHHMTEKEASKLEARRRKAEDSSRRADTEFYTVSVRAERARLEYESTVRKGAKQMELLEEERLSALKDFANVYLAHLQALAPRLQQSADRLSTPIRNCNVSQDVEILRNLIRRIDSNEASNAEQLLPDFYAEHVTLAMNRERRKQSLVRVLHLIRQDLERERRGREGLETLHRAFIKTPAFAADESTQNVTDKLHHMRSMLLYLEAARYKVGGTLAEVEGSKRGKHPLAEHILVSRDKQGLQQSVLKIPSWAKNDSLEMQDVDNDLEVHLTKEQETENRDWADRTAGDGNSENPPDEDDFSDFDEFSSHSEDNNNQDVDVTDVTTKSAGAEQCRAIYQYSANLNDELSLSPGDLITVHQKQADGWWIGECRGRTGIFPATYVQVIH